MGGGGVGGIRALGQGCISGVRGGGGWWWGGQHAARIVWGGRVVWRGGGRWPELREERVIDWEGGSRGR